MADVCSRSTAAIDVKIAEAVPAHAGLGSGTQLALAVAAGVRRLHNLPLDVEGDAVQLGRGTRSGIGIGLFHHGGLVVDGGRGQRPSRRRSSAACRFRIVGAFWLFSIRNGAACMGRRSARLSQRLPPMPDADAAHICRLVLMQALPALAEHDLASFGAAIKELQMRLGDYFARLRAARASPVRDVAAVLDALDGAGAMASAKAPGGRPVSPLRLGRGGRASGRHRPATSEQRGVWTSGFARGSIAARRSSRMRVRSGRQ